MMTDVLSRRAGAGDLRRVAAEWLSAPGAIVAIPDESAALMRAIDRCLRAQAEWLVSEALLVDAVIGDGKRHPFLAGLHKGYPEFDPNQPRDELGRWARRGPSGGSAHDDYRLVPLSGGRDQRYPPRWPNKPRADDPHPRYHPPTAEAPPRGDLPHRPEVHRRGFLREEEGGRLGGHTYRNHITITDRQLQNRAKYEGKASRWADEATAERITRQAIVEAEDEIAAWLDSDSNRVLSIKYRGEEKIGEGYNRGSETKRDRRSARILLKKDGFGGYGIISTFPE